MSAILGLTFATGAYAAEQRRCDFELAIFPNSTVEEVSLKVVIAASERSGRVRVDGSGEWAAHRSRSPSGADELVFDTSAAVETITIGVAGEALWLIEYRDEEMRATDHVAGYAGTCRPWQAQR